jgi:hypothetical protein
MRFAWWKNFWRERATPPHFRQIVTGLEWPEQWASDTVFVQGEDGLEWAAAFVCPCGCGDIVYLSLLPQGRPRWRMWRNWQGLPTISPSVWRKVKCHSHFIVRNGRVIMCRWDDYPDDD